jgi:hypothetical protein
VPDRPEGARTCLTAEQANALLAAPGVEPLAGLRDTVIRQTHNSRTNAPIRSRKAKERVRRGEGQNPLGDTPEQVAQALRERNTSPEQRQKVSARGT